jgi:hypothetical protein
MRLAVQPESRPDPLAPPEGYGRKKPDGSGPVDDGSVPYPAACSVHAGDSQCRAPLAMVIWYGDAAEPAGPVGYCMSHGMLAMLDKMGLDHHG